ncbi:hypothetical protein ACFO4N_06435 [Camelliibacillus cellulosilyticus]|uniref:Uncharacterized protein n=1 Tax=Camelliibacillus cellulosilyticus TaxID=2174486 RepID=A0ABV9GJA2_9BACL
MIKQGLTAIGADYFPGHAGANNVNKQATFNPPSFWAGIFIQSVCRRLDLCFSYSLWYNL